MDLQTSFPVLSAKRSRSSSGPPAGDRIAALAQGRQVHLLAPEGIPIPLSEPAGGVSSLRSHD
jgi:hypothetical protein